MNFTIKQKRSFNKLILGNAELNKFKLYSLLKKQPDSLTIMNLPKGTAFLHFISSQNYFSQES